MEVIEELELTIKERIVLIEKWIGFWETVKTGWNTARGGIEGDASTRKDEERFTESPYTSPFVDALIERAAKAAFEENIRQIGFSNPRLGMRTATWEEIGQKNQKIWHNNARAAIAAIEQSTEK